MPKKIPWDIKSLNILTSLITKQQNILLDSLLHQKVLNWMLFRAQHFVADQKKCHEC